MENNPNQAPAQSPNQAKSDGNNTLMSILAYLGPLLIISWATSKDNETVKFHIRQGLVLIAIEVILWLLSRMFWSFHMITSILELGVFILAIIGIINVVNKKQVELPLVGHLSKFFKI